MILFHLLIVLCNKICSVNFIIWCWYRASFPNINTIGVVFNIPVYAVLGNAGAKGGANMVATIESECQYQRFVLFRGKWG